MTITTLSSREFNQDTSGAKKAAQLGPVIITDRGGSPMCRPRLPTKKISHAHTRPPVSFALHARTAGFKCEPLQIALICRLKNGVRRAAVLAQL